MTAKSPEPKPVVPAKTSGTSESSGKGGKAKSVSLISKEAMIRNSGKGGKVIFYEAINYQITDFLYISLVTVAIIHFYVLCHHVFLYYASCLSHS